MHTTLMKLLYLSGAGALGTLARYGLSGLVQRMVQHRPAAAMLPWGTLAVNALGCLMFGVFWALAEEHAILPEHVRVAALVGFLGAFTTFSTFAFENTRFIQDGQWLAAAGNLALHNVTGVALVIVGLALVRRF